MEVFSQKTKKMEKYFLHGKLTAKNGQSEQLVKILLKASENMKATKGCRLYVISMCNDEKENIWITEIWDSKYDHDNSLKNKKNKELIMQAIPLLESSPEKGQELKFLGGFGI